MKLPSIRGSRRHLGMLLLLLLLLGCAVRPAHGDRWGRRSLRSLRPSSVAAGLPTVPETAEAVAEADLVVVTHNQEVRQDAVSSSTRLLTASAGVGVLTAALGLLYARVLSASVTAVWHRLPQALMTKGGYSIHPVWYITTTCTVGGLLVGLLSSVPAWQSSFTVAAFVALLAGPREEPLQIPSCRAGLPSVLLLSLVTATCGFSVGPEAPMVCAGALVGAAVARQRRHNDNDNNDEEATLAYAGAAGALTAFMGLPIAGAVFALELTRAGADMAAAALSPCVVASVAAFGVMRGLVYPQALVGGHYDYGTVGALTGRTMIRISLAAGVGGAVLGTVFHKSVAMLKQVAWPVAATTSTAATNSSSSIQSKTVARRGIFVKTTIGLMVGLISSYFPQTLFWGEGSLQCMVDGQKTAFAATKHGLADVLTSAARVNPNLPFASPTAALQVGLVKFLAIVLACVGKFPGGIIFPLFFAAAPLAHATAAWVGAAAPVWVMCLMAATQASVTRTPLATALILSLSAAASAEVSVLFPACLVASYLSVYVSQFLSSASYFQYSR
jgi:H+/Cl- antiporter ClcA